MDLVCQNFVILQLLIIGFDKAAGAIYYTVSGQLSLGVGIISPGSQ
jgi:hypothetical protein